MKILLVGCGKMGGALLGNWVSGTESFTIVDPALAKAPEEAVLVAERQEIASQKFDVIVVAIKPQQIDKIVPDYIDMFADNAYVMSIAAGYSIARLKQISGGQPVVRVMPNLPAAIGAGVSGICASDDVTDTQLDHATNMMERAGTVIRVADEDKLDRFTAVAGSGPGYVFEFARSYIEAALELGFDKAQAHAMVLGTLEGSIAMVRQSGSSPEDLRNSVTSKNGTTEAGLEALNGNGELSALLKGTLAAAYERARELR